ncbi:hypothetical protein Dda_4625 [Drechslerella dactyloides]|uniref:tRNA (guanine(9)-N1)-methyltransferase n=1 Tax=Drechslerella dactyloides TaxID=74499 RepID=A0AAD6IX94_DREDA|nr:hypothetical protein Dda_4625 [Drechslerella dactyloides]
MTTPDAIAAETAPDEAAINGRKRKRSTSPNPTPATATSPLPPADPPANDPSPASTTTTPISKNQQKKLLKKQKWEESRESRRAFRREKMAAKRARQRDARLAAKSNPTSPPDISASTASMKRRNIHKLERQSRQLPITCIVDCSFDSYMTDKESTSLASQVSRCYSDNRIAPFSMDLHVTCVDKRLRAHLDLMHGDKWHQWRRITVTDTDYTVPDEAVEAGNVIYLSSDSDETLETLDEGKTYIVGGVVDKNRHKGLCFNKAVGQGLRTAKLPIGEYIKMTGRITLTTNQVVEIMLRWLELRDWKLAFEKAIPMRKQKGHKPGKDETAGSSGAQETNDREDGVDVDADNSTDDEVETNLPMNLDDDEEEEEEEEEVAETQAEDLLQRVGVTHES